jgi:hypothetical protein
VTDGQVSVPVDESQPASGGCAWCGTTTSRRIELEKARYRKDPLTGVRVIAKSPIVAWVCGEHDRTLRRTKDEGADAGAAFA